MKVGDLVRYSPSRKGMYRNNTTLYVVTWINHSFMRVLGGDRAFQYVNTEWSVAK